MVSRVELNNFRSHQNLKLDFKSDKIAITGDNAVGKTNLLEAIYYGFLTKSFRSTQTKLIRFNEDYLRLKINFSDDKNFELDYKLQTNSHLQRKISLNGVNKKPKEVIGLMPVVVFLPDDVRIITDSPQYRRKFINGVLLQTDQRYLNTLARFQKLLKQRNQLLFNLKTNKTRSSEQLFVYNLQLASPIEEIYKFRRELIDFINSNLSDYYSKISGSKNNLKIDYLPTLPPVKDEIIKQLESSAENDKRLGYSTKGPHKDDFIINLNGVNSREGLSRGENRSLVLSLKLIELDYINSKISKKPILLLDDVLSELDDKRQKHLLNSPHSRQTFITSTFLNDNIKGYEQIKL